VLRESGCLCAALRGACLRWERSAARKEAHESGGACFFAHSAGGGQAWVLRAGACRFRAVHMLARQRGRESGGACLCAHACGGRGQVGVGRAHACAESARLRAACGALKCVDYDRIAEHIVVPGEGDQSSHPSAHGMPLA
jgi:hypothetical protein